MEYTILLIILIPLSFFSCLGTCWSGYKLNKLLTENSSEKKSLTKDYDKVDETIDI